MWSLKNIKVEDVHLIIAFAWIPVIVGALTWVYRNL